MSKHKAVKDDSERWMISYADLLTLLLALFIVLYAQSKLNVSRIKHVSEGMIQAFHGSPAALMHQGQGGSGILKHESSAVPAALPSPRANIHTSRALALKAKALNQAEEALKKVLRPLLATNEVRLSERPLSLRIRLNAEILFTSGRAALMPKARTVLSQIASVIGKIPHDYPIVIQGYTNNEPIHSARFPSNWELSTSRALSVVHLFIHQGFPGGQLSAQGFGKYHPIASNLTSQGLRDNRRVEIVIKSPAAKLLESRLSLDSVATRGKTSEKSHVNGVLSSNNPRHEP